MLAKTGRVIAPFWMFATMCLVSGAESLADERLRQVVAVFQLPPNNSFDEDARDKNTAGNQPLAPADEPAKPDNEPAKPDNENATRNNETVASDAGGEAETPVPAKWLVGAELKRQFDLPASALWRDAPLRESLTNFSRRQRVAVMLDRRVDPDQLVHFDCRDRTLIVAFETLAAQLQLNVGRVGDALYLGPPETAGKLATLVAIRTDEVRKLPQSVQRRALARASFRWPILAEPRSLLERLSDESGISIVGADRMPHDLWPAVDLPPLTWIERVTIVLAGFGVTFEWSSNGESVRLVAIPASVSIEREYTRRDLPGNLKERLESMFPDSQFTQTGTRLTVDGPWETHEYVNRLMSGETIRRPNPAKTKTVFTLKVENQPALAVLQAIAGNLKLELSIDPAAREAANELVSFDVENATLDELLETVASPVGLAAEVADDKLVVTRSPR